MADFVRNDRNTSDSLSSGITASITCNPGYAAACRPFLTIGCLRASKVVARFVEPNSDRQDTLADRTTWSMLRLPRSQSRRTKMQRSHLSGRRNRSRRLCHRRKSHSKRSSSHVTTAESVLAMSSIAKRDDPVKSEIDACGNEVRCKIRPHAVAARSSPDARNRPAAARTFRRELARKRDRPALRRRQRSRQVQSACRPEIGFRQSDESTTISDVSCAKATGWANGARSTLRPTGQAEPDPFGS